MLFHIQQHPLTMLQNIVSSCLQYPQIFMQYATTKLFIQHPRSPQSSNQVNPQQHLPLYQSSSNTNHWNRSLFRKHSSVSKIFYKYIKMYVLYDRFCNLSSIITKYDYRIYCNKRKHPKNENKIHRRCFTFHGIRFSLTFFLLYKTISW